MPLHKFQISEAFRINKLDYEVKDIWSFLASQEEFELM